MAEIALQYARSKGQLFSKMGRPGTHDDHDLHKINDAYSWKTQRHEDGEFRSFLEALYKTCLAPREDTGEYHVTPRP